MQIHNLLTLVSMVMDSADFHKSGWMRETVYGNNSQEQQTGENEGKQTVQSKSEICGNNCVCNLKV